MSTNLRVILVVSSLVLASLACQAVMGGGSGGDVATSEVIVSDDFSSSQWGTGTDADSSIEYANEALQMVVFAANYFVWSTLDNQSYQNVHMETTVINNGTNPTTAFGLLCDKQSSNDGFYYLGMTPAGQYAIAKAVAGQNDIFLTNNDQWATSNAIKSNASSYRIGADCGNGVLTLYVDGQQIDSVSDSTYESGGVGLFTWSGKEGTITNASFDDFLMTQLP